MLAHSAYESCFKAKYIGVVVRLKHVHQKVQLQKYVNMRMPKIRSKYNPAYQRVQFQKVKNIPINELVKQFPFLTQEDLEEIPQICPFCPFEGPPYRPWPYSAISVLALCGKRYELVKTKF